MAKSEPPKWSWAWLKWQRWVWGLLGVALIRLSQLLPSYHWLQSWFRIAPEECRQLIETLGVSIVIAVVLSVIVDYRFKQDLVKNAFHAAFGYMLPKHLESEMQWVYGQTIAATYNHLEFTIEPLLDDPGSVKFSLKTRRELTNHSNDRVCYPADVLFDLEEWCHRQGPSVIEKAEVRRRNDRPRINPKIGFNNTNRRWEAKLVDELWLEANETVVVLCDGYEFRAVNDHYTMVFRTTVVDPKLEVTILSPEIDHALHHSDRLEEDQRENRGGYYSLKGTLLPYQGIEIRWWRKVDLVQEAKTCDLGQ